MKTYYFALIGLCLLLQVLGCSGQDTSENPRENGDAGDVDGDADGDADSDADGDDKGRWCVEPNAERWWEDGRIRERSCRFFKCIPGKGCITAVEGCVDDDDCVDDATEAGFEPGGPVHCDDTHLCSPVPSPWPYDAETSRFSAKPTP